MEGDYMEAEYKKVPSIISTKDLDYLKDIFGWHHCIYKSVLDYENNVTDKEIKKIMNESAKIFYENMNTVLCILEDGEQNE